MNNRILMDINCTQKYFSHIGKLFLLGIILLYVFSLEAKKMPVIIDQKCDFSKVNISDKSGFNDCTPVIDAKDGGDVKGVFINGPHKFTVNQNQLHIPITMLRVYDTSAIEKLGEKELIVVVDVNTDKVFTGDLSPPGEDMPIPIDSVNIDRKSISPFQLNMTQTSAYNFNLLEHVTLPKVDAEYYMYMTMGPYKSNTIKIIVKYE